MFVIASWRPMHFERFQTGNIWDSFELTDDSYMRDPRPAIYELATLLAGEIAKRTPSSSRGSPTRRRSTGLRRDRVGVQRRLLRGVRAVRLWSRRRSRSPFHAVSEQLVRTRLNIVEQTITTTPGATATSGTRSDIHMGMDIGSSRGLAFRPPSTPRALAVDGHRPRPVPQALPGHFMPGTESRGRATKRFSARPNTVNVA